MREPSSSSVNVTYPRCHLPELTHKLAVGAKALLAELPVERLVLFGSWAAGRATAFSDIDVLVVYRDPPGKMPFG